jgi:hypothetical protein
MYKKLRRAYNNKTIFFKVKKMLYAAKLNVSFKRNQEIIALKG